MRGNGGNVDAVGEYSSGAAPWPGRRAIRRGPMTGMG